MAKVKEDLDTILDEMFTESTGRSMLDSGSAYGRHWERNQENALYKNRNPVEIDVWGGDHISATISTYHVMKRELEPAPKLQEYFDQMANLRPDDSWYELMQDFPAYMHEHHNIDVGGPGGMAGDPFVENTYNSESILSQVLQLIAFCFGPSEFDEHVDYALIQLHNGCDVRGGYTKPRAFRLPQGLSSLIMRAHDFSLTDGDHHWDFEGPYELGVYSDDYQKLSEYQWASAKALSGLKKDEDVEVDSDALETIQAVKEWDRKLSNHNDLVTDEMKMQHEENRVHLLNDWVTRLKEIAADGTLVYFEEGWPDAGIQSNTIFSPENGEEMDAYF